MNKRLGKNDYIFLLAIVFLSCVMLVIFYGLHSKKGEYVLVTVDGNVFGKYSLVQNQEIDIINDDGKVTNHLVIRDGKADMTKADCPDGLCVNQKAISLDKETIVCLPNKVVVEIVSSNESDIDAVAN